LRLGWVGNFTDKFQADVLNPSVSTLVEAQRHEAKKLSRVGTSSAPLLLPRPLGARNALSSPAWA
jgi:hypothetical protein